MAPGRQERQVTLGGGKFIIPQNPQGFQDPKYWDTFFASRNSAFEWYGNFLESAEILCKYIKPRDDILVIGSGNSELSADMYYTGLRKITNIDISQVVVDRMTKKYKDTCPDMKFVQEDVMNMKSFADESFSVVLDKATFDALVADDTVTSVEIAGKICREVDRVLKFGGRYICITLGQRHVLDQLVINMVNRNFAVRAHVINVERAEEQHEIVFCFVFTKMKRACPLIFDIQLRSEEKISRMENLSQFLRQIREFQTMEAFSRSLKRGDYDVADGEHMKIFSIERTLKFNLYPYKQSVKKPQFTAACFIIPPGRSNSYLYGTHEGRKEVALKSISASLVMFVEVVEVPKKCFSFESVKEELTPIMKNLCPPNLFNSMVFISDGAFPETDVVVPGDEVVFEGTSETTGDYRILDRRLPGRLESERRLVFLNSPQVSQTEIRLKKDLASGDPAPVFDKEFLPSDYQRCIIAALLNHKKLACPEPQPVRVLLIGLGGGVLASFIHHNFPTATVEGVELDPSIVQIAIKYFGFLIDEKCFVHVGDGFDFVKKALNVERYDVIIIDADTKDPKLAMRCPPEKFVSEDFLRTLFRLLNPSGMLLFNIVTRKKSIADSVEETILSVFGNVIYAQGHEGDLNCVVAAVCRSYVPLSGESMASGELANVCPKDTLHYWLDNLRNFNRMMDDKCDEILFDGPSWWSRVRVTFSPAFLLGNIRMGDDNKKDS